MTYTGSLTDSKKQSCAGRARYCIDRLRKSGQLVMLDTDNILQHRKDGLHAIILADNLCQWDPCAVFTVCYRKTRTGWGNRIEPLLQVCLSRMGAEPSE